MKELVIFSYIVMTICTTIYTSLIMKQNPEKRDYVQEVHAHMASIMFFHAFVIALVVWIDPFFLNNIYVSILNTSLSIMFSVLYYMTDKKDTTMLYLYNAMYLFFASVLVAEVILYFENDTFIYTMFLIFCMFLCDLVFYKEERKNKLLMLYGAFSSLFVALGVMNTNYFYSVIATAIYGIVVLVYMYTDVEYLKTNPTKNHLDDALKYFLDVEGIFVRYINNKVEEKKTDKTN